MGWGYYVPTAQPSQVGARRGSYSQYIYTIYLNVFTLREQDEWEDSSSHLR